MNQKDIVRHKLVTRIVNAYERYDRERQDIKQYEIDPNATAQSDETPSK